MAGWTWSLPALTIPLLAASTGSRDRRSGFGIGLPVSFSTTIIPCTLDPETIVSEGSSTCAETPWGAIGTVVEVGATSTSAESLRVVATALAAPAMTTSVTHAAMA